MYGRTVLAILLCVFEVLQRSLVVAFLEGDSAIVPVEKNAWPGRAGLADLACLEATVPATFLYLLPGPSRAPRRRR